MLLGTLVPEEGELRLCRRLSESELERSGCWPITGGERVLVYSFEQALWRREECPDRLVKDAVLRQVLRGRPMLLRRREGGFCLAAQYDPDRPFPIPALFCLSRTQWADGKLCVVFCFDRGGNPIAPHNRDNSGENSGTS